MDKTKILMTNGSLMKVKSIAECSPWSILRCFWPALSDNWSWKPFCGLFEPFWPFNNFFTVAANLGSLLYVQTQADQKQYAFQIFDTYTLSL